MAKPNVLGIVLAGGEGQRLLPLTLDRAKPAVPFGGSLSADRLRTVEPRECRIPLLCVLTQYKSHSLDRHISVTWRMSTMLGNFVTPVPAQQRLGKQWYMGSADAIYQSMNLIDEKPDIIVVFGADHGVPDGRLADGRCPSRVGCRRLGGRHPYRARTRPSSG